MSRGRCESRPGPTEGSLQSSAAAFYFTQILSGHLIAFHECSPFKYFSVDFVALFSHYFFNIFLNISMPEVPQNTTEARPVRVSTSRFVTEVKSSTASLAGAKFRIISCFRENYSSEIMHNIYRYLHRLAFSVTFSHHKWKSNSVRKQRKHRAIVKIQYDYNIWEYFILLINYLRICSSPLPG